jgi:predicted pyridoxine 5'-phosphate oxidase superfamily flavin-nucleotide-binding protein
MTVKITDEMQRLLLRLNVAVVATIGPDGTPNLSLKGVVEVDPEGSIYFLDLYEGKTRNNLEKSPKVALTVFSVKEFKGYQFKGEAVLIHSGPLFEEMARTWVEKRRTLLSRRISENVRKGFSHGRSETRLPEPKYLVKVEVREIYNLVPESLRK